MLAKETYKVNTPKKFVFGDPLDFEQGREERLKELAAIIDVPENFTARAVLEEIEVKGLPDDTGRVMTFFFSEDRLIKKLMQGQPFKLPKKREKMVDINSASYFLRVDNREKVFYTGGDGYWGSCAEYYRNTAQGEITAGIVVTVVMPDHTNMNEMRAVVRSLFDGMRKVKNVERDMPVGEHEADRESGQELKSVDGSQDAMTMS